MDVLGHGMERREVAGVEETGGRQKRIWVDNRSIPSVEKNATVLSSGFGSAVAAHNGAVIYTPRAPQL